MTNKDASGILKTEAISHLIPEVREALWMGASALEEEHCGDYISKRVVIDIVDGYSEARSNVEDVTQDIISDIMASPPVNLQPCEDAISRRAAIEHLQRTLDATDEGGDYSEGFIDGLDFCIGYLSYLPSVTPMQSGWIPVTFRPMTDEEKKDYSARTGYDEEDLDTMINCQLPEDGETVLVTDRIGNVEVDTFIRDCDGCYFECNCDMEDVRAWMPLPAPYEGAKMEDKSCDTCKHNAESWESDACDGCCGANSKWSGESYPGEFEAMEHNGRMDALESEEQA